jgi:hypothetical protein
MKPTGKTFFASEQRKPLHRSTVNLLLRKYSAAASLPLLVHPQMPRHACGFALADQGADTRLIQDYLGHRTIQPTVKYTATNPARFDHVHVPSCQHDCMIRLEGENRNGFNRCNRFPNWQSLLIVVICAVSEKEPCQPVMSI